MRFIYSLLVYKTWLILHLLALFSPKLKLFVRGRKNTFTILNNKLTNNQQSIWIHAASLGEFEQGIPIIEGLKKEHPDTPIVLSFFSPSGYEVKKNSTIADVICYLPLDTPFNAKKFIEKVNPKMVLFIKYEIWPNYLKCLKQKNIPTYLVSAIFKENQVFFKWYGSFLKKSLHSFKHFFVQDTTSKELLNSIHFNNVSITGDTRLDRVSQILEQDNQLEFMDQFTQSVSCFIAGSTWKEDEEIIVKYINETQHNLKYVIAPHTMKAEQIAQLKRSINKKTVLYSEIGDKKLEGYDVIIIDTIGLLTKIYSYAEYSYVGGAFATGLHNTMEPAVFGIPIIIGPKYSKFKEAEDLVRLKGILSVNSYSEFKSQLDLLLTNTDFRNKTGALNKNYILQNKGAAKSILSSIIVPE